MDHENYLVIYQVSHYIRVKKQRNIQSWDQQNYLVIRGFCYIRPLYNKVSLYNYNSLLIFYDVFSLFISSSSSFSHIKSQNLWHVLCKKIQPNQILPVKNIQKKIFFHFLIFLQRKAQIHDMFLGKGFKHIKFADKTIFVNKKK